MGNQSSTVSLQPEDIERIENETGFTASQIDRLYSRFTSLDKEEKGYLSREDFLRIPELAINPLGDRIVHAFFYESLEGTDDKVNFTDFVRVLSHFRPIENQKRSDIVEAGAKSDRVEAGVGARHPNSRMEKLHFAFRMYDLDGDEMISRDELLAVLSMMVGSNISQDQLQSIAHRTISEADSDKDGLISFEEFVQALEKTDVEQKMSIRFLS
jgi:calcineurin B family protein 1